jgi:hypothetical protein
MDKQNKQIELKKPQQKTWILFLVVVIVATML